MAEIKTIKGIVKSLRQDRKGLQLNDGTWYSNKFLKGTLECQRGDEVEITCKQNGQYLNLETVTVLKTTQKKAEPFSESRDAKDAAMLTSYAKDLVVAGKAETIDGAAQAILLAYRKILGGIKEQPQETQKQEEAKKPVVNENVKERSYGVDGEDFEEAEF